MLCINIGKESNNAIHAFEHNQVTFIHEIHCFLSKRKSKNENVNLNISVYLLLKKLVQL